MVIAAGVAAVIASCGSGDDERRSPTSPGQTQPATAPSTAEKTPAQPSGRAKPRDEEGSGGTSAPSGGADRRTPQEAQRDFEKYCETHPGACGD
jgi:hypothetical protein